MYYITINVQYVRYSTGRKIKYFIVYRFIVYRFYLYGSQTHTTMHQAYTVFCMCVGLYTVCVMARNIYYKEIVKLKSV
jgi:hypothetical protein